MESKLTGTAGLVTGASSGVGAASARRLADHGASVVRVAPGWIVQGSGDAGVSSVTRNTTLPVPPARTGRKGRKPSSAFVQVEATYSPSA
jgi:hypothetical protein